MSLYPPLIRKDSMMAPDPVSNDPVHSNTGPWAYGTMSVTTGEITSMPITWEDTFFFFFF